MSCLGLSLVNCRVVRCYAAAQACPYRVVVGIKVVWLHVPHIAGWVDEAVWRVRGNIHGAPKVADKEAKGMPLAGAAPSFKSILCCLEVNLYVLDKV